MSHNGGAWMSTRLINEPTAVIKLLIEIGLSGGLQCLVNDMAESIVESNCDLIVAWKENQPKKPMLGL